MVVGGCGRHPFLGGLGETEVAIVPTFGWSGSDDPLFCRNSRPRGQGRTIYGSSSICDHCLVGLLVMHLGDPDIGPRQMCFILSPSLAINHPRISFHATEVGVPMCRLRYGRFVLIV